MNLDLDAIERRANAINELKFDDDAMIARGYYEPQDVAFVSNAHRDITALVVEVRRLRAALVVIEHEAQEYGDMSVLLDRICDYAQTALHGGE